MKYLFAAAVLTAAAGAAHAQVVVSPATPYVEITDSGDSANFDIIVTNAKAYPQTLSQIDIVYLDAQGATVWERRIDGNGVAPAIATIPGRELDAGASKLIFNPFPVQPPGQHAASVRIRVALEGETEAAEVLETTAKLQPTPALALRLPLSGKIWVWDGHDLLSHHRRWDYTHPAIHGFGFRANAMRYSYDLVPVDAQGRMVTGDEARNENFVGFGAPVMAPADGTVVEVQNDYPDDRKFDPAVLSKNLNLVFGNYVVIRHANGLHSILGHVKQGSVTVRPGDTIKQGQVVAAIGASGSSLFPHLHYQLQQGPDMNSEGVPSRFDGVRTLNRPSQSGAVDSGDIAVSQ
jgi:murein DD-endopeptidase MepM/ murein hydrolase activator NlpD